jgi:hypothetical protein
MTAEIVIMNKSAIALAADSAGTIQMNIQGKVRQKIFNTSNKLFMLSKYNPIGILIYGNSEILGTPWELIIKEYRKKIASSKFSNIKAQALDFINYLNSYFPSEIQDLHFRKSIESYYSGVVLQQINSKVEEIAREEGVDEEKISKIVSDVIKANYDDLSKRKLLAGILEDYEETIKSKYKVVINKTIKSIYKDLPIKKIDLGKLKSIGASLFVKEIFPDNYSGIVIAGFGDTENFPSLFAIQSDGVVNSTLKYSVTHNSTISLSQPAIIIPIAQKEMVITFIEGVDPDFYKLLEGYLSEIFKEYPKVIIEGISDIPENKKKVVLENIQKQGYDIYKKLQSSLKEYKESHNISQVMSIVEFLPKDELAAMAESLVNLTSFKRRVSLESETVGGPIDVAVISKGDGFIWIKRKHYFRAELNPHFVTNYYRECE